jgi:hypothetical protein
MEPETSSMPPARNVVGCVKNPTPSRTVPTIVYQTALRPALPCIYGPVEFREFRDQLVTIDGLLVAGSIEDAFVQRALAENAAAWTHTTPKQLARFVRTSVLALRCNVARKLTGLPFREFAVRAAESSLLQWFLRIGEVDRVKVPSKSTLERFAKWVSEETMTQVHLKLISQSVQSAAPSTPQPLGLLEAVDPSEVFFDSTCLKAPIHFPVDWVLLRDAARTLMKATVLIRRQGLKQRMPQPPLQFLSEMNKLGMAMSACRGRADSKKRRKRVLRQMKTLEKKIAGHARSHRALMVERRAETGLTARQAQRIIDRIDHILTQLPAAIRQAHERIIGERAVPHAQKILSLYEPEATVIKRHKAGAEVEFGNKLWLAETRAGLIVDWALSEETPADTALVVPSVGRLRDTLHLEMKQVWGDRGLFSQANEKELTKRHIKSGLCPRDPAELQKRLADDESLRQGLRRRGSGTEARIAIFKHCFAGSPCRTKGLAARTVAVGWAVLAHNLWVLARLKLTQEKMAAAAAKKKAA